MIGETNPSTFRQSSPSTGRQRTTPVRPSSGRTITAQSVSDPLGFFSAPSSRVSIAKDYDAPTRKQETKKSATIDWLGINAEKEVPVDRLKNVTVNEQIQQSVAVPVTVSVPQTEVVHTQSNTDLTINLAQNLDQLNETTLKFLKQQENRLSVASELKQQENVLIEMSGKQKMLLEQQEQQFNEMLKRQLHRQTVLDESIRRQQAQIDSYLNILKTQPEVAIPTNTSASCGNKSCHAANEDELINHSKHDFIELEAEVKRLQLEKLRLENIVECVRTNHDQELDLIANSHK